MIQLHEWHKWICKYREKKNNNGNGHKLCLNNLNPIQVCWCRNEVAEKFPPSERGQTGRPCCQHGTKAEKKEEEKRRSWQKGRQTGKKATNSHVCTHIVPQFGSGKQQILSVGGCQHRSTKLWTFVKVSFYLYDMILSNPLPQDNSLRFCSWFEQKTRSDPLITLFSQKPNSYLSIDMIV